MNSEDANEPSINRDVTIGICRGVTKYTGDQAPGGDQALTATCANKGESFS